MAVSRKASWTNRAIGFFVTCFVTQPNSECIRIAYLATEFQVDLFYLERSCDELTVELTELVFAHHRRELPFAYTDGLSKSLP